MKELIPPHVNKIIVAPLNWGLGHATRSIPIINALLEQGKEVIMASDGEALGLLRTEFPHLSSYDLPSYKVKYNSTSLLKLMLSNSQNVRKAIKAEQKRCEALVKDEDLDMVISDSRFGFRSKYVPSVIISHQLYPHSQNPILKWFLERGNRYLLNSFDACWVPDNREHRLSGLLSQNRRINNVEFIGPLSRLEKSENSRTNYDLTIILSGPEPARTKLESDFINILRPLTMNKICLVRGTNQKPISAIPLNWTSYDLAPSQIVNELLLHSSFIVSRSGYSSIMDYAQLEIGAYLIPTPGQSEQEYLAEYLDGKYGFVHLKNPEELLKLLSD